MHIIPTSPFYSRTSEGAEAANEICRAGSWVGWRLRLTGGRLPAVLCDVTARLLSLSVHQFFFLFFFSLACFISRGSTFSLWDRERRLESQNDTLRLLAAAWTHDRQKPQTFATSSPFTRYRMRETEKKREAPHVTNKFMGFILMFFFHFFPRGFFFSSCILMKQIEFQ